MKTALYRHFDAEGQLLYVGISLHAIVSLARHKSNARWFDRISTIKVVWFDTRKDALKTEKLAILNERPAFNNGKIPTRVLKRRSFSRIFS
jgi:hypothetical protein